MSSINTDPQRFYFVHNNRLALVEKNGLQTTDNASTAFKTITEAKPLRIHTISRAAHFNHGGGTQPADYTDGNYDSGSRY